MLKNPFAKKITPPSWEDQIKSHSMSSFNETEPEAYSRYGHAIEIYYPVVSEEWDGEKTIGELGAPIAYEPNYYNLSYRSWQAYTESDLAQILVKTSLNWFVGYGLKLQAEPNEKLIQFEGFNFDKQMFVEVAENRFRLFADTQDASYSKMVNFNKIQRQAYFSAKVGGDVLCIMRIGDDNLPNIQLIDGINVCNPNKDQREEARARGNRVVHGVELDSKNTHVAFYVRVKKPNEPVSYERVEAIGPESGREVAHMLYVTDHRIDDVRGMPYLSVVLEKMKKLDRYNEAIVGSVEERAKVPWWFEHGVNSTGENPDLSKLQQFIYSGQTEDGQDKKIVDMTSQTTAIRKTFQKEPYNLPIGSTMKVLAAAMETNQEAFVTGNFIFMCAALEMPYEMALMKFVNNFSASRMASQSFQQIINLKRKEFNDSFNQKFYNLFLDVQILSNKIPAEGYFTARNRNDVILLQAFRKARFVGPNVPHADPGREVTALVDQINNNLLSREKAMERLGNDSDFVATVERLAEESRILGELFPEPIIEENINDE